MNLRNYKKNLFNELTDGITIEYDSETQQYSLINDNTPGIFGLGDTKEDAIREYLSGFSDMILLKENIKNETPAFT